MAGESFKALIKDQLVQAWGGAELMPVADTNMGQDLDHAMPTALPSLCPMYTRELSLRDRVGGLIHLRS